MEGSEADQAAGEGDECFVDVGSAFVAEAESAVLVEPGEGAFDDPALAADAGAVRGALVGDHGSDPLLSQPGLGGVGVVAAVAEQRTRASPQPAARAGQGRDRLDQGEQLADVGAVRGCGQAGERDPGRVGDQVVLRAELAPVDRARPCFGAPKRAGTEALSTTTRDQSIRSA